MHFYVGLLSGEDDGANTELSSQGRGSTPACGHSCMAGTRRDSAGNYQTAGVSQIDLLGCTQAGGSREKRSEGHPTSRQRHLGNVGPYESLRGYTSIDVRSKPGHARGASAIHPGLCRDSGHATGVEGYDTSMDRTTIVAANPRRVQKVWGDV